MFVPVFSLNLGQKILPRRVTVGCYDGVHPCLTAATIGDKVLIHNPHNRSSLTNAGRRMSMSSGASPLDISMLNINQPVNAVCAGRLDPTKDGDCLLVGTPTSLLAYDVQNNSELFYKEMTDGVNALVIGNLGSHKLPLSIAGGNCTIQGFDHHGNDPFWTVTGDNVTSLCLADYNSDEKLELIVGSEDYDIRVFKNDEIIAETSETEAVIALCHLQGSIFGYALANGTVGAYNGSTRCWRIKSKNQVVSIVGFDLNMDGVPELITGWSNGKVDARNMYTGEVIFKDNFTSSVAGIVVADYRMDGKIQLICCSTDGEVRGYLPSFVDEKYSADRTDFSSEQETIRDLSQRKQALLLELKNYEENAKLQVKGNDQAVNSTIHQDSLSLHSSVIPAASQLQTTLTVSFKSGGKQYVELAVSTTNDTLVKAVMIFAEGIFKGESHVVHPDEVTLSGTVRVPLIPPRDIPIDLHVKVLVGYAGSQTYHVFELTRQLPRFSMYAICDDPKSKPKGSATFQINERVQRVLLWINQNFLLADDLELKQGALRLSFIALRTNQPLTLSMEQCGKMIIGTDDMSLAGEIFQSLATFLNLDEDVTMTADFPDEMVSLSEMLRNIEEYGATRQSLVADMADNSALVRSLVVRAEDARLMGDLKSMRQWYSELYTLNQEMIANYQIRCNNQDELFNCLKSLHQMIQKASQLRVGKSKAQLINACRMAVRNNDLNVLFKTIKSGAI